MKSAEPTADNVRGQGRSVNWVGAVPGGTSRPQKAATGTQTNPVYDLPSITKHPGKLARLSRVA